MVVLVGSHIEAMGTILGTIHPDCKSITLLIGDPHRFLSYYFGYKASKIASSLDRLSRDII